VASKLRLAVIIVPVILGSIVFAIGFNMRQQTTDVITSRAPPIYGIMPFSSLNFDFDSLRSIFWILNVKNGTIKALHDFMVSLPAPLNEDASSGEQIFGFQFPYRVTFILPLTKAKGWSELESDSVPIEIIDKKVHIEEETSIVYLKFTPLQGIKYYDFEFWFYCRDTILQETFSTYTLYIPIQETEKNVFVEYFTSLDWSVHHLDPVEFEHFLETGVWLPQGSQVIDIYPPLTREVIVSGERMFTWRTIYDYGIEPHPQSGLKVLRIKFEMREDVERHDRLLYESGLFIGIGISNLIAGCYGILRYLAEKPGRIE